MVLFLPDENAQLKRKVLPAPFPALPASEFSDARKRSAWQEKLATSTVQKLLQTAPQDFPAGARLSSPVVLKGDVLDLNFNSAFAQSQFWQGSARTLSSVYSLVNSVSNTAGQSGLAPTKPKVRFLIDGKPIEVLGELSMDEPLEADMKLVAGA
jgi:spore germination protein GerM